MRYDDETIEFDPGFNTIVGPTDSGKSTCMRALVWLMYSRPLGLEMIREGAEEARVTAVINRGTPETPDLHTIVRVRSKKRNAYIIDGQEFDNVKTDVPAEAKALTGVETAEIGPKVFVELNVSRQMDGPFMLTGSGGDAAKIMGNLAGITTLDTGLASIKPDLSAVTKELGAIAKMEENYAASIGEFAALDVQGQSIERTGERIKAAHAYDARLETLRRMSAKMTEYNGLVATVDADIAQAAGRAAYGARVTAAKTVYARLSGLQAVRKRMATFVTAWNENEAAIADNAARRADLATQYKAVLHEAGQCPTCGQAT